MKARSPFGSLLRPCQTQVRFFASIELNHTLRCLCGPPSIPLSFSLATVLPGGELIAFATAPTEFIPPTPSSHRLQRGLPGYLIPFAPHAFAPQCQVRARAPLSPLVFLPISTHSTTTPGILHPSLDLKPSSLERLLPVKPRDFTPNLLNHLRALYAQ